MARTISAAGSTPGSVATPAGPSSATATPTTRVSRSSSCARPATHDLYSSNSDLMCSGRRQTSAATKERKSGDFRYKTAEVMLMSSAVLQRPAIPATQPQPAGLGLRRLPLLVWPSGFVAGFALVAFAVEMVLLRTMPDHVFSMPGKVGLVGAGLLLWFWWTAA